MRLMSPFIIPQTALGRRGSDDLAGVGVLRHLWHERAQSNLIDLHGDRCNRFNELHTLFVNCAQLLTSMFFITHSDSRLKHCDCFAVTSDGPVSSSARPLQTQVQAASLHHNWLPSFVLQVCDLDRHPDRGPSSWNFGILWHHYHLRVLW
jgi:hypothetical protein